MKKFATILKSELKSQKMTQTELARLSGVSHSAIVKFINGARPNPTRDVMDRVSKALDVPPAIFFQ